MIADEILFDFLRSDDDTIDIDIADRTLSKTDPPMIKSNLNDDTFPCFDDFFVKSSKSTDFIIE